MQAAIVPHCLPKLGDIQEHRPEVFVHNLKESASALLEQPVVVRQEWEVLMSHHRTTPSLSNGLNVPRPDPCIPYIITQSPFQGAMVLLAFWTFSIHAQNVLPREAKSANRTLQHSSGQKSVHSPTLQLWDCDRLYLEWIEAQTGCLKGLARCSCCHGRGACDSGHQSSRMEFSPCKGWQQGGMCILELP